MLDGIDPLLTGELLWRLDGMGHGDGIALVDAHFPQPRDGQPLLVFPGVDGPALARAIGSVLPLDPETPPAIMAAPDGPREVHLELADAAGVSVDEVAFVERHAFYDRARAAIAVIRTGERRPYGNLILYKGLVQ